MARRGFSDSFLKVAFQAKRYQPQNSVGIGEVHRFRGSKNFVEEENAPIRLVDGKELVQEMINQNLGVKTVPVVEHQIDERFFSRLAKE